MLCQGNGVGGLFSCWRAWRRWVLLLKEGLPEGSKLAYGWHFQLYPRCPCGGDVGPDECQGRFSVWAGSDIPVDGVTDGFSAVELGELDAEPGRISEAGWAVEH